MKQMFFALLTWVIVVPTFAAPSDLEMELDGMIAEVVDELDFKPI